MGTLAVSGMDLICPHQIIDTAKVDSSRSSKQFSMQNKTFSRVTMEHERGYSLGQMSRSDYHNETFRSASQRMASNTQSLTALNTTGGSSIGRTGRGGKSGIWTEDSAASLPGSIGGPNSPIKRPQTSAF
jgi:hypothetical protein